MNKELTICICLVVIGGCGWVANNENEKYLARKFAREQLAAAAEAERQLESQKQKLTAEQMAKKHQELEVQNQQKQREQAAARTEIQDQLKGLKVSSVLMGSPSLAIINKKSYEEGGNLALPNGKSVKIAAIRSDGVVLAYGGLTFQLGLPTARDIGGEAR